MLCLVYAFESSSLSRYIPQMLEITTFQAFFIPIMTRFYEATNAVIKHYLIFSCHKSCHDKTASLKICIAFFLDSSIDLRYTFFMTKSVSHPPIANMSASLIPIE